MSAARTARGGSGGSGTTVRRSTGSSGSTRKRSGARAKKKQSIFDGLPVSPATAKQLLTWGGVLALVVLVIATLFAFRVPQRIAAAVSEEIGAAGFAVKRVELRGLNRMDQATIYRAILCQLDGRRPSECADQATVDRADLGQRSRAMPMVDLDAIRAQLMSYPWIKEARVSRRLPDTLVVEIVEREPVAVWQFNRHLQLVDIDGVPLAPVDPQAIPHLPLVVGPEAQHQVAALDALLDSAPELRSRIAASSWIGGRRWDLTFATGETLALPEGEAEARAALQRFVQLASEGHLFDGRFVRFDMRIGGQMTVQRRTALPAGTPQNGVPAVAPARPARPGQPAATPPADLTRTI